MGEETKRTRGARTQRSANAEKAEGADASAAEEGALAQKPTVRLHLWLERGGELYFGMGRALLLQNVERLGSLKKAAESMGMSYRAAWGKLRQSERALGEKLVERRGPRSAGGRLTPAGRELLAAFSAWFAAVERDALREAQRLLPFAASAYAASDRPGAAPGKPSGEAAETPSGGKAEGQYV